ncbi:fungal-specific transcription factor domain-containing protein [Aspergillus oleicola]
MPEDLGLSPDLGGVGRISVVKATDRQTTGRRKRPRVPDAQRKRVRVACENCRRSRLRCNGSSPCERCQSCGRRCFYNSTSNEAPREGRINYSNSSSVRSELLFAPDSVPLPPQAAGVVRERGGCTSHSHLTICERCSERGLRAPAPSWKALDQRCGKEQPSTVASEPDGTNQNNDAIVLNSTLPPSASIVTVNQWKTHFEGTYSHWAFFSSVRQAVSPGNVQDEDSGEADCGGTIHQISNTTFGSDWRTGILSALPPRGVVDFLTATYFRFAQSGYFCVHPEIFSRKLAAFYDGVNEFAVSNSLGSRRSVEFISLLFMVLAIGSQFAEVGDTTAGGSAEIDHDDAFSLDLARIDVPTPSQNPGWRFYEVSRRLLPDLICSSSMTSVQVCLLQGLFLPSTTSRNASYNILGLAMRMAINMGLHRSFSASSLHAHVRELRNRLWWSVYIADRLYTTDMGRPLSVNDSEIDAPLPKHMPDWANEAMNSTKVDTMIVLARHCQLLGRIVESVYCRPSSVGESVAICPSTFLMLKKALEDWQAQLPAHLTYQKYQTRSVAHLHLMYDQANLLLTRPCLNSAVVLQQSSKVTSDKSRRFLQQQTQACVDAAVSVVQIMSALRSRSLLCGYSFHDALYCSSALYVLLLVERKLGDFVKVPPGILHEGISILLVLAKDSEAAASSLRYLLRVMLTAKVGSNDNNPSRIADHSAPQIDAESKGRNAWKAWKAAQDAGKDYGNPVNESSCTSPPTAQAEPQQGFDIAEPTNYVDYGYARASPVISDIHIEGIGFPDVAGATPFWMPSYHGLDGLLL